MTQLQHKLQYGVATSYYYCACFKSLHSQVWVPGIQTYVLTDT